MTGVQFLTEAMGFFSLPPNPEWLLGQPSISNGFWSLLSWG